MPTPPLQNRSPSNLLPSKHNTTIPKMASTKSLPSKMGSFKMHFFKKIRCSILYFVDKVGVWTGDPALAREVSAPHYFVEKMITGIIYIYIRKNCHVSSWVKIIVLRWCLSQQALSNTSFLVPRCWGLPPVAAWTCQDPPAGWWSQAHPPFMLDIGPECVNPLVNRGKGLL